MEQMGQIEQMTHSEAVHQMAAERYLLGELPPEVRDAFENHLFDCPECAFDIRAGVAFVDEARVQLPGLTANPPVSEPQAASSSPVRAVSAAEKHWWSWLFATPAFAAPVFATLLVVIGYQNLVTLPALRTEATEPRLLPAVALHAGTRGGAPTVAMADRKQGVLLQLDLPSGAEAYTSYAVELYNPQGKLAWSRNVAANAGNADAETLSIVLPGEGLEAGDYALAISGVAASGQRSELERQTFNVQFHP